MNTADELRIFGVKRYISTQCEDCFVQHELHWEHVTHELQEGPYLPTVPELTHMPLSWRFSPVTQPGQRRAQNEEVFAVVPVFIKEHLRLAAALSHP